MSQEKICNRCKISFHIAAEDLDFYQRVSPSFSGLSQTIPTPTLCPDCRLQRRFAFRNERNLYKRRSCLSNTDVITTFSPESPYKVCSYEEWWSDAWNAQLYARSYDPHIPFTDQLLALSREVPHCPLYLRNGQNSDYNNFALNLKDCYLIFGASDCELCLYGKSISACREVVDALAVVKSELCYEGTASENCYHCLYFSHCVSCTDCFMLEACESCTNCALCFGLYRKEYYILNEYVGKARYQQFMQSLKPFTLSKIENARAQLDKLKVNLPHRESYCTHSENCSGDNISHSKNCWWSFDIKDCEDCKFLFWTPKGFDSYDCCYNSPDGVELCYEVCSTLGSRNIGTFMCWNNDSTYYSIESHYNRDIFGCVGLRHKQYCILNKQYSKDEYEQLTTKIIEQMRTRGEWGEYLPEKLSMFGYNETIAQEYFPLTKEQAAYFGFYWREEKETENKSGAATNAPPTIDEVDNSILDRVLICAQTRRAYKITPSELNFYRKMGIPIPELCPDERHARRLARRTPLTLWKRSCAKTGQEIWTSHPPQSTVSVYSNEAYRQYLYGMDQ